jgi:hypothetical protein
LELCSTAAVWWLCCRTKHIATFLTVQNSEVLVVFHFCAKFMVYVSLVGKWRHVRTGLFFLSWNILGDIKSKLPKIWVLYLADLIPDSPFGVVTRQRAERCRNRGLDSRRGNEFSFPREPPERTPMRSDPLSRG